MEWGHLILSKIINRNRYKELIKHLRFDNCSTRCKRRQNDKFCLLLETWNNFIEICKKFYVPSFDLTIEEQLFLCKARCLFIQYMPNKPDKFGINLGFWLMFVENIFAMVSLILVKTQQETGKRTYQQISAYG